MGRINPQDQVTGGPGKVDARLIERALARQRPIHSGYQGAVHEITVDQTRIAVKTPTGRGPLRWLRQSMLRNEARAYARLVDVRGVPRCYGLVGGRFLLLEHVDYPTLRTAAPPNPAVFLHRLRELIETLHGRGVAHSDLKRRENILLDPSGAPLVIDFGMAVRRRQGMHPLNRWLYRLACQLDRNAWCKHRSRIAPEATPAEGDWSLRRTRGEMLARKLRPAVRWFRHRRGSSRK